MPQAEAKEAIICDGCSNRCKRLFPFRRCIHDIEQAIFTCPEFGLITWSSCPAITICKNNCPGFAYEM